jgi:hypothetical protein
MTINFWRFYAAAPVPRAVAVHLRRHVTFASGSVHSGRSQTIGLQPHCARHATASSTP